MAARQVPREQQGKQKKYTPIVKTDGEYGIATMAMITANMPMIFTRASSWWMKLSRYAAFSM